MAAWDQDEPGEAQEAEGTQWAAQGLRVRCAEQWRRGSQSGSGPVGGAGL